MNERIIEIAAINPVHIFGVNDVNIDQLRKYFPKLKIIARGNNIKVMGKDEDMDLFEQKIERLVEHYNTFGTLTPNAIDRIMDNGLVEKISPTVLDNDIIVYGNNGLVVRARTPNQLKIVESCMQNDMVFAIGPAGSGKTYTAVAIAV